jgi:hypothetical protein
VRLLCHSPGCPVFGASSDNPGNSGSGGKGHHALSVSGPARTRNRIGWRYRARRQLVRHPAASTARTRNSLRSQRTLRARTILVSRLEQGCEELASAGRPAKLQSVWTIVGFNRNPDAKKASTVALGLDCTGDCGELEVRPGSVCTRLTNLPCRSYLSRSYRTRPGVRAVWCSLPSL